MIRNTTPGSIHHFPDQNELRSIILIRRLQHAQKESTSGSLPSNRVVAMNSYSWKGILRLHRLWTEDRGMSFFLGVLVVMFFVVLPLADLGFVEKFLVDIGFSIMLISGAVATHRNLVLTWIIILLTIAGLVVHWMGVRIPSFQHPVLDAILISLLFGCFVLVLLLQVFRAGRITLHRILGAVAAYLSIGIAWGYAYFAASIRHPDAVRFAQTASLHRMPVGRYVYFSFVTLTTLGYGDAVPMGALVRSLVVAEALIGQLYPAVLIAGLLGLALQSRTGTSDL
jgi:hypothetical protein